jgi:hypothetical protein
MKKSLFSIALSVFLFGTISTAQNIIEKSEDQVKLFNAQQEFYKQEYVKALNLYKEVLVNRPKDANVVCHIGECYFMMEDLPAATEQFEKSVALDPKAAPDAHLYLGKLYLLKTKLDSAGKELEIYRTLAGKVSKVKESDVELYINMVKTAKELMAKPIDVTIVNLGENINSQYDDKRPSVTADGKTMVFTSRRPEGKSQGDMEGDKKYFDHIYMSSWNDTSKTWNPADFMTGTINGSGHNACSSITQDGKQIFIYRNNDDDAPAGEIFVSKVTSAGKWGTPKIMERPINSTYFEDGACLSADGNTLFFISERGQDMKAKGGQKGYGNGDIWMSKRKSKTEWDTPVNMGPEINTPYDEGGIFIHPDGKTLFFCSQGHNSMGGYDIFKTTLVDGKWGKPVNLGYPINTVNNETSFCLSLDGNTAYISSNRPGGLGERDIYKVDMSNYDVLGGRSRVESAEATKLSILKGTVFTGETGKPVPAEIVVYSDAGVEVGRTAASEDGNYFITLEGDKNYEVRIEQKGCKPVSEKFKLDKGKTGTFTLVRHFLLYKS